MFPSVENLGYIPGHTKVCKGKHAFSVILIQNADGKEEAAVVQWLRILTLRMTLNFIPACILEGTANATSTLTLKRIGSNLAIAMVDTGYWQ